MAASGSIISASVMVDLQGAEAADPARAGAKAANLARAALAGMPVLPGLVLPTDAGWPDGQAAQRLAAEVMDRLGTPLVVRSSSVAEDLGISSMAGQFTSVLDVDSPALLTDAIAEVRASAHRQAHPQPMAVLIQPQLTPLCGGVMFGVDPLDPESGLLAVEIVAGGPDALVSGRVSADRYRINVHGRIVDRPLRPAAPGPTRGQGKALARLAAAAAHVFGGPQDIEFAITAGGDLVLLQSRPVTTTEATASAGSPILGRGPVAETFPDPLQPLEVDLWVVPMRDGIRAAVARVGAVAPARLESSPILTVIDGLVVADLELLGYEKHPRSPLGPFDPRPGWRRLRASVEIGRSRATLPGRCDTLAKEADTVLQCVPTPAAMADQDLLEVLRQLRDTLSLLHEWEVLAVLLSDTEEGSLAGAALRALAGGRAHGLSDAEIAWRDPVVLALIPPRVGPGPDLPRTPRWLRLSTAETRISPRERLRLRIRWMQELQSRVAWELGVRWAQQGLLPQPSDVSSLDFAALSAVADTRQPPMIQRDDPVSTVLPTRFRLAQDGRIVPLDPGHGHTEGVGASGGIAHGPVAQGVPGAEVDRGSVLVVDVLDPAWAPQLPLLSAIVSESGSTLSHLAILAREQGIPAVVARVGACADFPTGTTVQVNGWDGTVHRIDDDQGKVG